MLGKSFDLYVSPEMLQRIDSIKRSAEEDEGIKLSFEDIINLLLVASVEMFEEKVVS